MLTSNIIDLRAEKNTIVVYWNPELVVIIIDPVGHVTTIGCAQTGNTLRIGIRVLVKNIIKTGFKVTEMMRTPIVTN